MTVIVTAATGIVLLMLFLGPADRHLDYFVHFGSEKTQHVLADAEMGHPATITDVQGWDGQEYWVLAHDPLYRDPDRLRPYLPAEASTVTRIGYPLLVWPFHLLAGGDGLLVGLLVVNLGALALAIWSSARLALGVGVPATASLIYGLNPGVTIALTQDLSDVLAAAFTFTAVLAMQRNRWVLAISLGVAAASSREVALLSLLGVAFIARDVPWKARIGLAVVPTTAYLALVLYVRTRLGTAAASGQFSIIPLQGFVEAWQLDWSLTGSLTSAVLSIAIGAVAFAAGVVCLWRRTLIGAAAAPALLFVPFLSGILVHHPIVLLRLLAPALTLAAIDLLAARAHRTSRRAVAAAPAA